MYLTACLGLLLFVSLAPSAMAAGAQASNCQAPPGTSGIDQYCESLPSAGSGHHNGSQTHVSDKTKQALEKQGSTGAAVLELAGSKKSTGSKESAGKETRSGHGSAGGTASTPSTAPAPGDSPLPALKTAVENGSSAGPAYVWVLVGVGVLLSGLAWIAYRRRGRLE
jgi:hypothetical protein